jgi:hypothetical protein
VGVSPVIQKPPLTDNALILPLRKVEVGPPCTVRWPYSLNA